MPDRILHRTWSIRTVSPFVRPLVFGISPPAAAASSSSAGAGAAIGAGIGGSSSSAPAAAVSAAASDLQPNEQGVQGERRYPSLSELADELTGRLRACPDLVGPAAASSATSGAGIGIGGIGGNASSSIVDVGGTYATLAWIVLDDNTSGDDSDGSVGGDNYSDSDDRAAGILPPEGRRKRSRTAAAGSGRQQQLQRHLHVDIRINDEPAGQVLLCFSSCSATGSAAPSTITSTSSSTAIVPPRNNDEIKSFAYLLVRGQIRAYRPILLYFESTFGCSVGTRPFTPSPADVASSLATWMIVERYRYRYQQKKKKKQRQEGERESLDTTATVTMSGSKPLELILAVPRHLAGAGLERITVTVPPVSLARLCTAVEKNRPTAGAIGGNTGGGGGCGGAITPLMVTDSDRDDESSSCWAAAGGRKASPSSTGAGSAVAAATATPSESPASNREHDATEEADDDKAGLPILRALQCYLYEAFHIDARHLHVARAATAHAVVGTDGRIKPMTVEALPSLLSDLEGMVRRCDGRGRADAGGGGTSSD